VLLTSNDTDDRGGVNEKHDRDTEDDRISVEKVSENCRGPALLLERYTEI
jgi:hypothetical protein